MLNNFNTILILSAEFCPVNTKPLNYFFALENELIQPEPIMDFIDRIEFYCKANKINQSEFERQAGLSKGLIIKWKKGNCVPGFSSQLKIARLLNITTAELMDGTPGMKDTGCSNKNKPAADYAVAGPVPLFEAADIADPSSASDLPNVFAVRAPDDSMSPLILKDDTLFITRSEEPESGDIFLYLSGGSLLIRRSIQIGGGYILQPVNSDYEPFFCSAESFPDNGISIIGRVTNQLREY